MKTEKELEKERNDLANHMLYMPPYEKYEFGNHEYSYWLMYIGLLETRYLLRKSFNRETKKYEYY